MKNIVIAAGYATRLGELTAVFLLMFNVIAKILETIKADPSIKVTKGNFTAVVSPKGTD